MWNYLPDSLLNLVSYTPTSQYRRMRGTYRVLTRIVGKVLEEKIKDVSNKGDNQRDVMSVLSGYCLIFFILTQGLMFATP